MAKSLKLIQGCSYTYRGKKYMKGEVKAVEDTIFAHLMGKGKFEEVKASVKVRVTKPDDTDTEEETEVNEIPNFRSKQELADYAEEKHDLIFEDDLADMKMTDMREALEEHIVSQAEDKESEPSVEV